jgi:hypothetical protein
VTDAFYIDDGDNRFTSTERTIGPWGPDSQHAGPPAALLGRAIELCEPRPDLQVASIVFDILKPVPVAPIRVEARVARPGKSVELVEATMSAGDTEVMRARAWRIRTGTHELDYEYDPGSPPPGVGTVAGWGVGEDEADVNYLTSMDVRFVAGAFLEPGPATAWFRPRFPLVGGEDISAFCRVLIGVDSASGISATLDWSEWLFVNPDLSVYLHRLPETEWICLDAATYPETTGIGMATSTIWDEQGPIGRSLQSLFIAPRSR